MKGIFCPNCGKKNKKETKFCRSCGGKLPKLKRTVTQQDYSDKIKKLNYLNFSIVSIVSLFCSFFSIYLMLNDVIESKSIPLVFTTISVVLFTSSVISMKCNKYLKDMKIKEDSDEYENHLVADTNELLPEADFSNNVPASVIENTTRKLEEKVLGNDKN